jgi:copper(I)-binding protein
VAVIRSTSRSVLAGLVVVGGLALAGCGSGQVAQTAQEQPTVDGSTAQVGPLAIRYAALEYPNAGFYEKGSNARLRMVVVNDSISSDALVAVRTNAAAEVTLTGATSAAASDSATPEPAATSAEPTPTPTATGSAAPSDTASGTPSASASGSAGPSDTASASATPTEQPAVQVAIPPNGYVSFTGDGPRIELVGLTEKLWPSQPLSVTLVFQKAGEVSMTIAVATPDREVSPAPTVDVSEG